MVLASGEKGNDKGDALGEVPENGGSLGVQPQVPKARCGRHLRLATRPPLRLRDHRGSQRDASLLLTLHHSPLCERGGQLRGPLELGSGREEAAEASNDPLDICPRPDHMNTRVEYEDQAICTRPEHGDTGETTRRAATRWATPEHLSLNSCRNRTAPSDTVPSSPAPPAG